MKTTVVAARKVVSKPTKKSVGEVTTKLPSSPKKKSVLSAKSSQMCRRLRLQNPHSSFHSKLKVDSLEGAVHFEEGRERLFNSSEEESYQEKC